MFKGREKSVWHANIEVNKAFNTIYYYLQLNASDNCTCHSQVRCCFEPEYLIELHKEGKLEVLAKDLAMEYLNATIAPNAMRMLNDGMNELFENHKSRS